MGPPPVLQIGGFLYCNTAAGRPAIGKREEKGPRQIPQSGGGIFCAKFTKRAEKVFSAYILPLFMLN
jgi:hypothetical protein